MDHHRHIIDSCVNAAFDLELYTGPDTFEDEVLTAMIRSSNSMLAMRTDAEERCKWCGRFTENTGRKCDDCLRDIEEQRRIDERRGK